MRTGYPNTTYKVSTKEVLRVMLKGFIGFIILVATFVMLFLAAYYVNYLSK